MGPFMFFMAAKREEVKAANPELKTTEIAKVRLEGVCGVWGVGGWVNVWRGTRVKRCTGRGFSPV